MYNIPILYLKLYPKEYMYNHILLYFIVLYSVRHSYFQIRSYKHFSHVIITKMQKYVFFYVLEISVSKLQNVYIFIDFQVLLQHCKLKIQKITVEIQ